MCTCKTYETFNLDSTNVHYSRDVSVAEKKGLHLALVVGDHRTADLGAAQVEFGAEGAASGDNVAADIDRY